MTEQFRFDDGKGYETMMGLWSRLVGDRFLDWLAPASAQKWIDVGCGNGAFTELVVERCAPTGIKGIDPSESQLAFARSRNPGSVASYHQGDGMALPFADGEADIAVSALVLFFMSDPQHGVREMARVVRPGGTVATYAWDLNGGGFPYAPIFVELDTLGIASMSPPHPEAGDLAELGRWWAGAGIGQIETTVIEVARRFASFEDYWAAGVTSPRLKASVGQMTAEALMDVKARLRAKMPPEAPDGSFTPTARAHAVKGVLP